MFENRLSGISWRGIHECQLARAILRAGYYRGTSVLNYERPHANRTINKSKQKYEMLALMLVGALLGQPILAKPTANCVEFCDDQSALVANGGVKTGGYSSYSKSSYRSGYASGGGGGSYGSSSGLGSTGSRLESLDDSVLGVDTSRPGSWQDQKHYVTDDGHGEMKYKASQTVTNNGFSKYAEHSYRYGSNDKHLPTADSQILSLDEFQRETQNIRSRISNFMGSFNFAAGSYVSSAMLQDFKHKASQINSQLNNVCNQVDTGSSMYQQMQQMMQQFQQDVEERQREIEAMVFSSSSTSESYYQQHRPVTRPAPVQQYPTSPSVSEASIIQQQQQQQQLQLQQQQQQQQIFEQKVSEVQTLISSFYQTANQPSISSQYQQNFNSQVEQISQQLSSLTYQATQNESFRARISQMKKSFEDYVASVRTHIQQLEQREREEELRREEEFRRQQAAKLEKERLEAKAREEEHARFMAEQQRKIEEEAQRFEEERRKHAEMTARLEAELRQSQTPKPAAQLSTQRPTSAGTYEVHGSSSYEHRVTGSIQGGSTGSYVRPAAQRPEKVFQPHIDLTATFARLQQDLHRLENEVNQFNTYAVRLTASNSARIQSEAQQQAEVLRQNIKDLCDTSSQYQNNNVLDSAKALERRFEDMFRNFESQAQSYSISSGYSASAGYSSESSYGSSGRVSSVRAPSVSNVEYTHSKSTDVEVGQRPGYSASSGYGSANSYGSQVDDQFSSGVIDLGGGPGQQQLECVEMYAGQPCVSQPRRHKRDVGEEYEPEYESSRRHRPIYNEFSEYDRNEDFEPYAPSADDYSQQLASPYDTYDDDLSQRVGLVALPEEQPPSRGRQQQARPVADLTWQPGATDDYYAHQKSEDQQRVIYGENDSFQKPRGQVSRPPSTERPQQRGQNEESASTYRPRGQILGSSTAGYDDSKIARAKPGYEQPHYQPKPVTPESQRPLPGSGDLTLQKSGFYDQPASSEKPGLSREPQYATTASYQPGRPQLAVQTEEPQSARPTGTIQQSRDEDFTLEKSDFDYYPGRSERPIPIGQTQFTTPSYGKPETKTENQQSVLSVGNLERPESTPKSTLEKSGFYDYPSQSGVLESSDKTGQARPLISDQQQSEQVSQRENVTASSLARQGRVEKPERFGGDLTQRTAGGIDFGPESHAGRQFSQGISKPEKFGSSYSESQETKPSTDRELGNPAGQYIRNVQPPQNLGKFDSNLPNRQLESANLQPDAVLTTTAKSAPKLEPRYTRPWQVGRIHNVQIESGSEQAENENANIEESLQDYQNDSASHSAPHRGDLPGYSEPSSTSPPVVEERPTESSTYTPTTERDSQQQYEQVDLNNSDVIHNVQKPRNEWYLNNSVHNRFSQSGGGAYRFNQQNEYSHRSHYYSQHNGRIDLTQQVQKPFDQQNSHVQYDSQLKPAEFNQQQGGMYQYHRTGKLEFQHQQSSHYTSNPVQFDQQGGQLQYNRQANFDQQIQNPAFEQLSSRSQVTQQQQSPFSLEQEASQSLEKGSAAIVIPIDGTRPMDMWPEFDEITTPRTFWKRMGHKLSDSFDKAKERARTIFG